MVAGMKHDDKELFERAMETLGVKGQPKAQPKKKKVALDAPTALLPDDDLDFDALMRDGRGPAKLESPRTSGKKTPDRNSTGLAATETRKAPARDAIDPARYAASDEERALFESAMNVAEVVVKDAERAEVGGTIKTAANEPRTSLAELIRRRDLEPEAQLDLHGKTRKDAERRVRAFLEESVREGWELVAIVCGRGVHSAGGQPVLKPLVERWLREELRAWVIESRDAPSWLGGSGTLIVRVRLDATR